MIINLQTNVIGSDIKNRKLTHIDREASVLEASKLMRKSGSTELLVTSEANGMVLPLGIVTASDIVTRVIATELDPAVLTMGDIAEFGITASNATNSDAKKRRRLHESSCETLAVLDGDGRLIGTVRRNELNEHSREKQN